MKPRRKRETDKACIQTHTKMIRSLKAIAAEFHLTPFIYVITAQNGQLLWYKHLCFPTGAHQMSCTCNMIKDSNMGQSK